MSWLERVFAGDEELGKKNDDHRPLNSAPSSTAWSARKPARGFRKRRIVYGLCAVLFLYLFVKNIPTDLGPNSIRGDSRVYRGPRESKRPAQSLQPPTKKPPRPINPSEAEEHYHDGPIKFYMLAASLHAVARLGGQLESNKNVMFAAASLKSLSEIVPLACEMARWDRNDVHLAVMGRDDMKIEEIKRLNGATEDCNIHWHDARPDYSRWSSDFRMEVSVTASLEHIQTFIHPQVIIIDDPSREDGYFVKALRSKAVDLGKAIIELPADATETMMWITRLDSGSLAAWPIAYVDILIQAPSESSGSLVRLLQSIQSADYFGVRRPHLTIELPAEIDPPTWSYLENFIWPPLDWSGTPHTSQVTLRHRIPRRTSSAEEASARLVESFYPARTEASNVLLLSPQVELSPLYYHYVIYSLLEYGFADYNRASKQARNLMGISLELPTSHLNDSTLFEAPSLRRSPVKGTNGLPEDRMAFLWQAPNNNAALYFGSKWMEFHSFLSFRLSKPPSTLPKLISEKHPAWIEYLLELMRAKGYALLYPNLQSDDVAFATIHDELYQVPEEFSNRPSPSADISSVSLDPTSQLTADSFQIRKPPPNVEKPLLKADIVSLLPNSGDLPELTNLPLLSFSGNLITPYDSDLAAHSFADTFRRQTGGCQEGDEVILQIPNSAADLFCHLEEVYDPYSALKDVIEGKSGMQENNEGMTRAEDKQREDVEMAKHLNRQDGGPTQGASKVQGAFIDEGDSSEELQNEFRAQMERQAGPKIAAAKPAEEAPQQPVEGERSPGW